MPYKGGGVNTSLNSTDLCRQAVMGGILLLLVIFCKAVDHITSEFRHLLDKRNSWVHNYTITCLSNGSRVTLNATLPLHDSFREKHWKGRKFLGAIEGK